MSVSLWSYIPAKCDGEPCPGDCDYCGKWDMCPPGMNEENDCANDAEMCEVCWETFGTEPPKEDT